MSTDTQTQPETLDAPQFTIIHRLYGIPVVQSSLNKSQEILKSYPLSKKVYDTTVIYGSAALQRSIPVQKVLGGQITLMDGYLNSGFDYFQKHYPYAFETPTDQVIARARQPADNAVQFAQSKLTVTLETIKPLQERLETLLSAPSNTAHQAKEKILGVSNAIIGEVESVVTFAKEHATALPSHVQTSLEPLLNKLMTGYEEVKQELGKSEVALGTRGYNVLSYAKEQAGPVLQEAVNSLKELIKVGGIKSQQTDTVTDPQVAPSPATDA